MLKHQDITYLNQCFKKNSRFLEKYFDHKFSFSDTTVNYFKTHTHSSSFFEITIIAVNLSSLDIRFLLVQLDIIYQI